MSAQLKDSQARLFAAALYQVRLLLGGHVGSLANDPVSAAAELAYALHKDALDFLDGKAVDPSLSLRRLERLEPLLGQQALEELRRMMLNGT